MKKLGSILFVIITSTLSAQTEYFNITQQAEDWNSSAVTNVEVFENGYYIFGAFSTDEVFQGTFIQRYNFEGGLEENTFVVDSAIVPNYAESMNLTDNGIIIGGGGYGAYNYKIGYNGDVLWDNIIYDPTIFRKEFTLSKELIEDSLLFIGNNVYNTDSDSWPEFSNVYLLKTNTDGEELWENEFNLNPNKFVRINSAHELSNGELILSGSIYSPWNPVIVRVDVLGNLINYYQFGQEEENNWLPWSVLEEEANTLTLVYLTVEGEDEDFGDLSALQIAQFDLSTDSFIYESNHDESYIFNHVQDFVKTPDGGYAATGYRGSDFIIKGYLVKYDADLNIEWEKEYVSGLEDYNQHYLYDLEITADGGFVIAGETWGGTNQTPKKSWLLKLDACGDTEWQGCTQSVSELASSQFSVYPNPAQDLLTLELDQITFGQRLTASIRNALGQEVFSQNVHSYQTELDVSVLSRGVYVLSLVGDGRELSSERIVIE